MPPVIEAPSRGAHQRPRVVFATLRVAVNWMTSNEAIVRSTRAPRGFALADDDVATLFVERGEELVSCGHVGVDRRAPCVADPSSDVLVWARERRVLLWRGLFVGDPTLDEPLELPPHIGGKSRATSRITSLALTQDVLFAACAGVAQWGGWDLSTARRPWFDGAERRTLGTVQALALEGDVLSVLFSNGAALLDVSDPRQPRALDSARRRLDERGWSPLSAVRSSEWLITVESRPGPEPAAVAVGGVAYRSRRPLDYSLGVYRRGGLDFAGRVSLDVGRPLSNRPSIDALDERLLLTVGVDARMIALRSLDRLLRDPNTPLSTAALADATLVARVLDADALDARLLGGAAAAVSVVVAASGARLARLQARRNPWGPTGVERTRARIVRLSFA